MIFDKTERTANVLKISQLCGFDIKKPMHAYLITSAGAMALREYSMLLAKALLCENITDDGEPCGHCPGCIKCAENTHPDIMILGRSKVTVKETKALKDSAFLSASEGFRKIFILEGMDKFSIQAQNTLLKIIEEPPAGVIFIITSGSKTGVLPTILSRCCVLTPSAVGYSHIEENIRNSLGQTVDPYKVQIISAYLYAYEDSTIDSIDVDTVIQAYEKADDFFSGRNTNIMSCFPKKKGVASDKSDTEDTEVLSKTKKEAVKREQNSKYRDSVGIIFRTFMLYARNVAVYKQSGGRAVIRPANEDFKKICARLSAKRAITLYEAFENAYLLSESNANPNALYAFLIKNL